MVQTCMCGEEVVVAVGRVMEMLLQEGSADASEASDAPGNARGPWQIHSIEHMPSKSNTTRFLLFYINIGLKPL
jgi:hypothetical protein